MVHEASLVESVSLTLPKGKKKKAFRHNLLYYDSFMTCHMTMCQYHVITWKLITMFFMAHLFHVYVKHSNTIRFYVTKTFWLSSTSCLCWDMTGFCCYWGQRTTLWEVSFVYKKDWKYTCSDVWDQLLQTLSFLTETGADI